ncbi:MAG: hypothetical protein EOP58_01265 [Sphingomonadales bacterium]|nr:MAG: hypothetical protein EOP58_01265 [Sphingomonadales bacterium]
MSSNLAKEIWSRNDTSLKYAGNSSQQASGGGVMLLFDPELEFEALPISETLPDLNLGRVAAIVGLGLAMWVPVVLVATTIF